MMDHEGGKDDTKSATERRAAKAESDMEVGLGGSVSTREEQAEEPGSTTVPVNP